MSSLALCAHSQDQELLLCWALTIKVAAKYNIKIRLSSKRRPVPADFIIGVSLSGLIDVVKTGFQNRLQSQINFQISSGIIIEGSGKGNIREEEEIIQSLSLLYPIDIVDLIPPDIGIALFILGRGDATIVIEQLIDNPNSTSVLAIVFHFMRADSFNKQDIVSMRDIFDLSTNRPSWGKLLEILKADDAFGIAFQEGQQMLIVNNRIRVSNERQFLACLQHLLNSNVLSSEALVCNI